MPTAYAGVAQGATTQDVVSQSLEEWGRLSPSLRETTSESRWTEFARTGNPNDAGDVGALYGDNEFVMNVMQSVAVTSSFVSSDSSLLTTCIRYWRGRGYGVTIIAVGPMHPCGRGTDGFYPVDQVPTNIDK